MPRGVFWILGTLPSFPFFPLKKGGFTVIETPFWEASAKGLSHRWMQINQRNRGWMLRHWWHYEEATEEQRFLLALAMKKSIPRRSSVSLVSWPRSFCEYGRFVFIVDIRAEQLGGLWKISMLITWVSNKSEEGRKGKDGFLDIIDPLGWLIFTFCSGTIFQIESGRTHINVKSTIKLVISFQLQYCGSCSSQTANPVSNITSLATLFESRILGLVRSRQSQVILQSSSYHLPSICWKLDDIVLTVSRTEAQLAWFTVTNIV